MSLLKVAMPQAWILRNQTESDYGIDVEIELASTTVSGLLLKAQVRTKDSIKWRTDCTFREPFASGKLLYWRMIRLPVVLILVDNEKEEVYWAPASGAVPVESGLPDSIIVSRCSNLRDTWSQLDAFVREFKPFHVAQAHLYRIGFYLGVFDQHRRICGRDIPLPLEPEEFSSLAFLFDETFALRSVLGLSNTAVIPWRLWLVRSTSVFGEDSDFSYGIHDEVIRYLEHLAHPMLRAARDILNAEDVDISNFAAKTALDEHGIQYGCPITPPLPAEFWTSVEEELDRYSCRIFDLAGRGNKPKVKN